MCRGAERPSHEQLALRIPLHFFFNDTATTEIYTLSLHDALPISNTPMACTGSCGVRLSVLLPPGTRSEEHTSELQSPYDLVCRLLLEKKNNFVYYNNTAFMVDSLQCVFLIVSSAQTTLNRRSVAIHTAADSSRNIFFFFFFKVPGPPQIPLSSPPRPSPV